MEFLDNFSELTQLIIVIVIIAVLFILVLLNNKRNKKIRYDRDKRHFTKNYFKKKKRKNK
jgi:competence protein ComGC